MGMFWNYRLFPRQRWDEVFGGGMQDAQSKVIASYMWDRLDGTEPDYEEDYDGWLASLLSQTPNQIVELAKSLCSSGFSYKNRNPEQAEILDHMMVGFFCQEGIEDLLQAKSAGDDGIKPFILEELLAHGRARKEGGFLGIGGKTIPGLALELAQFIVGGRRVDSNERPHQDAQYLIFWEHEVPKAKTEVEQLLARDVQWREPEFALEVRKNILAALSEAEASNCCLFGRYC